MIENYQFNEKNREKGQKNRSKENNHLIDIF